MVHMKYFFAAKSPEVFNSSVKKRMVSDSGCPSSSPLARSPNPKLMAAMKGYIRYGLMEPSRVSKTASGLSGHWDTQSLECAFGHSLSQPSPPRRRFLCPFTVGEPGVTFLKQIPRTRSINSETFNSSHKLQSLRISSSWLVTCN